MFALLGMLCLLGSALVGIWATEIALSDKFSSKQRLLLAALIAISVALFVAGCSFLFHASKSGPV
jgi:hypothetical protein